MDGRKGSVVTRMIRIAQISHADGRGGAAIAAYRLHKTVARHGVDSRMLVLRSYTEDPSVTAIGNSFAAKAVKFAMPSPELPQLDSTDNFAAHGERDVEFMMKEVAPRMAELLGVEPWSPENQEGFGCFSCHTPSSG